MPLALRLGGEFRGDNHAAVKHLREQGFPVTDEMCARLSPLQHEHINFLGRYAFARADVAGLAPLSRQRSRVGTARPNGTPP
ncbi:Tn3 family transposase [Nonomuraea sp. NPDC049714]|uniref:Tn3 family transposase n=1 Tax=Nonomuraea sp. NPDC049714 TaxID=3364357 RepID=UPI0037A4EC99